MPDAETFTHDVFLSHSAKDKPIVRDIAQRLKNDGIKVWFDEWELKPGDSIPAKIEEALEHSRVLVLCMSANAFGSDWAQLESGTFRFRDPLNQERRFIPMRLDDAPIKGSMGQFLHISWLTDDRDQEYLKLREACTKSAISRLEVSILASLAYDDPHEVSFTLRKFLREIDVSKPSEMIGMGFPVDTMAILFLRVCSPEVLDSLPECATLEAVDAERFILLDWIIKNAPPFARSAEGELLRLIQHSKIREALEAIEGPRIALNVQDLCEAEKDRFDNVFFRYVAQRDIAVKEERSDAAEIVREGAVRFGLVQDTNHPRAAVFVAFCNAFREIRDAFVMSPHFGLESHLSGRVRHGQIIGHILKPLVQRHLFSKRDDFNGQAIEIFWCRKLGFQTGDKQIAATMLVLSKLSEQIGNIAQEVKNVWIQSRIDMRQPYGMFDYAFSDEHLQDLFDTVYDISSIGPFLDIIFDRLLMRTRENLRTVRLRVTSELMGRLANAIDDATNSSSLLFSDNVSLPLRNELAAARQDNEKMCHQLERWFQDTHVRLYDADLNIVGSAAISMIERLNPDVRGRHTLHVESPLRLRGRFFAPVVHIIFFLLDNALRHSAVPSEHHHVVVTIRTDSNKMSICVENCTSSSTRAERAANIINHRIANLSKSLDPVEAVREGGSGFAKIASTLRYEFKETSLMIEARNYDEVVSVGLVVHSKSIFI